MVQVVESLPSKCKALSSNRSTRRKRRRKRRRRLRQRFACNWFVRRRPGGRGQKGGGQRSLPGPTGDPKYCHTIAIWVAPGACVPQPPVSKVQWPDTNQVSHALDTGAPGPDTPRPVCGCTMAPWQPASHRAGPGTSSSSSLLGQMPVHPMSPAERADLSSTDCEPFQILPDTREPKWKSRQYDSFFLPSLSLKK
jgi:hypothetical protein